MPTKRTKNIRKTRKAGKVSKLRRWMTRNYPSWKLRMALLNNI